MAKFSHEAPQNISTDALTYHIDVSVCLNRHPSKAKYNVTDPLMGLISHLTCDVSLPFTI